MVRFKNGATKSINGYVSDVVGAPVTLSLAGKAGTADLTFITLQECVLEDYSQTTGPTVMGFLQVLVNGVATGDVLDIVPHVSTNPQRPKLAIPIPAGARLSFNQLAV
jgi:hypothetical protein